MARPLSGQRRRAAIGDDLSHSPCNPSSPYDTLSSPCDTLSSPYDTLSSPCVDPSSPCAAGGRL